MGQVSEQTEGKTGTSWMKDPVHPCSFLFTKRWPAAVPVEFQWHRARPKSTGEVWIVPGSEAHTKHLVLGVQSSPFGAVAVDTFISLPQLVGQFGPHFTGGCVPKSPLRLSSSPTPWTEHQSDWTSCLQTLRGLEVALWTCERGSQVFPSFAIYDLEPAWVGSPVS